MANSLKARSMTGFAQKSTDIEGQNVVLTIKSVNGKGLDISIRTSSPDVQSLEPILKEHIKSSVKRGTVLVHIDVKRTDNIEQADVELLSNTIKHLNKIFLELNLKPTDDKLLDLAIEQYQNSQDLKNGLKEGVANLFRETLEELIASKEKEGEFLIKDIKYRIELLEDYLKKAKESFEEYESSSKEKLIEKAKSLSLEKDNPLVVNEIMLLLQKLDISEELSRIENHLKHLTEIITSDNIEKGKKIEFVSQELNREITTMSNKVPELSKIAVNMKYETDKIKQQSANLE
jgi:uncharacterized protein (TIGR00255 family)